MGFLAPAIPALLGTGAAGTAAGAAGAASGLGSLLGVGGQAGSALNSMGILGLEQLGQDKGSLSMPEQKAQPTVNATLFGNQSTANPLQDALRTAGLSDKNANLMGLFLS